MNEKKTDKMKQRKRETEIKEKEMRKEEANK